MRRLAPLALACIATSCSHAAPAPTPAQSTETAPSSILIEYGKPKNPEHEPLYDGVRQRRVLETLAEMLGAFHLPKTLTIAFEGCDGTSNAFYVNTTRKITFCYEYLADIRRAATEYRGKYGGATLAEATDGPVSFVLLHETGHAIFNLLKTPVLGREEDAADFFAALATLRMGKDVSMRLLKGAAWAYRQGAITRKPDESDFSDFHSLDAQRYYNILCLAYGSDPEFFAGAVTRWDLPKERAEDCDWEYNQARYAIQKLISPSIDQQQLDRALYRHNAR